MRAEYGYGRSSFTASYTDPALFGSRNSASVSVFHTDDRWRGLSFTEGRYMRTGASLRWGFPIPGLRWTRAFAGYSLSRYQLRGGERAGLLGERHLLPARRRCRATSRWRSRATPRTTRSSPRAGTRQNLTVEQSGGPLGGDGDFQKVTAASGVVGAGRQHRRRRSRLASDRHHLRASPPAGAPSSATPRRFPFSRFFLGGTQWGESLRGYAESEITPHGFCATDAASGGSCTMYSRDRLGNAFLAVTGEYAVRFNDNLSLSVFAEAGNLWSEPALIDPTHALPERGPRSHHRDAVRSARARPRLRFRPGRSRAGSSTSRSIRRACNLTLRSKDE